MMGRRGLGWVVASVVAVSAVPVAAQDPAVGAGPDAAPRVEIGEPRSDAYVSGPTLLRASVIPLAAASRVTFSVDGREVCVIEQLPFECEWDAGSGVQARQIRLVAELANGGRLVRTVRTSALSYVEAVEVDAVQVTVTVIDDDDRPVGGLSADRFRVYEDGRPQTVANFASEDIPLELVVAVDISGSMAPAMPALRAAVKEFLEAVPTGNHVTLLGFNDSVFSLTRRATEPTERARAVDRLAPWGNTALYDVLVRGIDMLDEQGGRKALVVFTDGEDQGSRVSLDDVERRLQSSDATLYMIGQGRGLTHEYLKKVMTRLVTPTGGRVFLTDEIEALRGAFAELLDELSNQYLLSYESTNTARDTTWREIRVDVDGFSHVRARQGYRAVQVR
jgi:Ca-activated chloride channel family protein